MPAYGYLVLAAGWIAWATPFLIAKRNAPPGVIDRRARWGIAMVGVGYALLWQGKFWERPLPDWRLALSVCFLTLAGVLSWTATRALGKQWRIDAGLSVDHDLVMRGPYSVVRHPIYTSMLCTLLGTGFMLTPAVLFVPAIIRFIAGTETRIRIEERLLASRFGDAFQDYKRRVPAYIPFVR